MPVDVSAALALALAAQAAPASQPATPAAPPGCRSTWPNLETGEIVVCAERSQGYRIDPDILAAKKMKRVAGRPSRGSGAGVRETSACAVGPHPMGCQGAGVNLVGVALTAAQMAARLAKGQEIGSMFVTDPEPSEYDLYIAAKRAREAEEAAAKAKANPPAAKVAR